MTSASPDSTSPIVQGQAAQGDPAAHYEHSKPASNQRKTNKPAATPATVALDNSNTHPPLAAAPSQHSHAVSGRHSSSAAACAAELASARGRLKASLRRFMDFPIPGINFVDILPLFQDPTTHETLLRALELEVLQRFLPLLPSSLSSSSSSSSSSGTESSLPPSSTNKTNSSATNIPHPAKPDVIVGLEARGFLFGPALALRLGAGFVPVRKKGKMPGPCQTAAYEKEYGIDHFQMQDGSIKPGQTVLVVDDIIATGGSAAAAGSLVKQMGGKLLGYLFILEISFLKGREKLGGLPVAILLEDE